MSKCVFNKVALLCDFIEITLRHGRSPVNLLHIFKTPFLKNTSGRVLLPLHIKQQLTGEPIVLQIINTRFMFSYREIRILSQHLSRLLCNAVIQPHFDQCELGLVTYFTQNPKDEIANSPEQVYMFFFKFEQQGAYWARGV